MFLFCLLEFGRRCRHFDLDFLHWCSEDPGVKHTWYYTNLYAVVRVLQSNTIGLNLAFQHRPISYLALKLTLVQLKGVQLILLCP